jgi:hypothetical protein
MDDKDDDNNTSGKVLTFPDGKKVSAGELGAPYIADQGGLIPTPELIDPQAIDRNIKIREEFVRKQPIVQAVERGADTREMITVTLREIVEEISNLKYERDKAIKEGRNATNHTISRIGSLRQLSEILIKRSENLRAEQLDLRSPRFQSILKLWMEFVYEAMQKSGLGDHEINLVFNTMKADMVDWEKLIINI